MPCFRVRNAALVPDLAGKMRASRWSILVACHAIKKMLGRGWLFAKMGWRPGTKHELCTRFLIGTRSQLVGFENAEGASRYLGKHGPGASQHLLLQSGQDENQLPGILLASRGPHAHALQRYRNDRVFVFVQSHGRAAGPGCRTARPFKAMPSSPSSSMPMESSLQCGHGRDRLDWPGVPRAPVAVLQTATGARCGSIKKWADTSQPAYAAGK